MKKVISAILGIVLLAMFFLVMKLNSQEEWNVIGGLIFMAVLNVLFVANMGLILYLVVRVFMNQSINDRLLETVKQVGGLAAAFGAWSTVLGLFYAFGSIETAKEMIPVQVIFGGLKVGVITVMHGLIIFCHALFAYIGLNLTRQATT
jgi:hypothetical protein